MGKGEANIFAQIPGQEHVKVALQLAISKNAAANAYLFWGQDGLGKKAMAKAFAAALLCSGDTPGCGACSSCRWVAQGNHPDLQWIKPASENSAIKVEQIRHVLHVSAYSSYSGGRRVVVIQDADRMTEAAANSLLKTLEESPDGLTFILITESPDNVLPTIKSRCQQIPFRPLDYLSMVHYLMQQGLSEDEAKRFALLSSGNPGYANRIISLATLQEQYGAAAAFMRLIASGTKDELELIEELEALEAKVESEKYVDLLSLFCRDLLVYSIGVEETLLLLSETSEYDQVFSRIPPKTIYRWLKELEWANERLRSRGNKRLINTVLVFRLRSHLLAEGALYERLGN